MTRQDLVRIKSRALRTRVWFRALSKVERAIIDLTIKCVEEIRSLTLENTISSIIDKMLESLENRFLSKVEKAGRILAENLGNIAQRWGNKTASNWKRDKNFIIYLGVNRIN
jgi:uncharacterized membrane-anchored protein YjiN (DUF445 family)